MSATRKKNFTLIEMLSVIAVIGILMGILLPVIGKIKEKGRIAKAKGDAMAIATAIKAYEQAYGMIPIPTDSGSTADKLTIDQYRTMMEILTGVDGISSYMANSSSVFNSRKLRFLDAPANLGTDNTNASGTTTAAKKGDYVDPWNNIYQICIDRDFSNTVSTGTGGLTLNGTVFVYSIGSNKVDDLGKNKQFGDAGAPADADDVCSWR